MAKLTLQSTPGFNASAGKSHEPKKVRLDKIVIDPEISKIFDVQVKVKEDVRKSILKRGFDPEQPIVLWKDILVDGRTRYTAAKEAGLEEIFAFEKEFASREDAILYAFERQAVRRNLSENEIIKAARMIPDVRRKKGQGRIAEEIAKMLHVDPSTVYRVRKIVKEGSPEDIEAIENGDASINSVYKKLANPEGKQAPMKKPEINYLSGDFPRSKEINRLVDFLIMETLRQDRAKADEMPIEAIAALPQIASLKDKIVSLISARKE